MGNGCCRFVEAPYVGGVEYSVLIYRRPQKIPESSEINGN